MAIEYWTAKQASDFLGVSLATLYAYVSRKGIRSASVPRSREHRYLRSDIEGLRDRKARQVSVPGELTSVSSITLLTEEGPYYRGRLATDLAETNSLEQVATLLWDADTAAFGDEPPRGLVAIRDWQKQLAGQAAVYRALALFPFLEAANPRAFDLTPVGLSRTGADILRWLTAIILGLDQADAAPIHTQFATALNLSHELGELLRRLLVLSADHGFEEGTYAVRAVASTGVTPWRSVATGLSVFSGRASKFDRNDSLRRMMAEIVDSPDGELPILRRIRDGEELPGFASRIYPNGDPRAKALLDYCERALGDDIDYRRLRGALAVAREYGDLAPNFALASIFAETRIGLEPRGPSMSLSSSEAPFLVGRAAGWVAHAIEQYALGETGRRQLIYRGPLPGPLGT